LEEGDRGPAVAYRADTVPPRPVRHLADVDELGPAVSTGEAAAAAEAVLRRAAADRQSRYQAVGERNRADALIKLKARFVRLVEEVLADAAAAGRAAGTTTEPGLLWLDLQHEKSALRYIDAFRQRLGLDKGRFLRVHGDGEDVLDQQQWAQRKHAHAERLRELGAEITRLTTGR
jgi:hypothetical protein